MSFDVSFKVDYQSLLVVVYFIFSSISYADIGGHILMHVSMPAPDFDSCQLSNVKASQSVDQNKWTN